MLYYRPSNFSYIFVVCLISDKGALDQFCLDLTTQASGGFIDPIIGREEEIERVVQIICRRTKNNPILLGDAGVGKTAIAEGLALRIANGDVPIYLVVSLTHQPMDGMHLRFSFKSVVFIFRYFQAKRILSLDIGLLIAGAKERGELESRVTNIIREVREAGQYVKCNMKCCQLEGSALGHEFEHYINFMQVMLFFSSMRFTILLDLELLVKVRVLALILATY